MENMENMKNMKKRFLRALMAAAFMTAAAASLNAQTEKTPNGLEYERNGQGGVTITGCTGKAAALVIPAAIEGLPVTSIGESAFAGYGLTSVIIPAGVTSIGDSAFSACWGLTSVIIPGSVTSIGAGAFSMCSSLTSVTIPASVTAIDGFAFAWCSSLTSITIPASVTSIGDMAFAECGGLTSVTFGPGSSISSERFAAGALPAFPGDLSAKYLARAGGAGTYTRPHGGADTWTKQP
jgi:hypothetical protein